MWGETPFSPRVTGSRSAAAGFGSRVGVCRSPSEALHGTFGSAQFSLLLFSFLFFPRSVPRGTMSRKGGVPPGNARPRRDTAETPLYNERRDVDATQRNPEGTVRAVFRAAAVLRGNDGNLCLAGFLTAQQQRVLRRDHHDRIGYIGY